MSEPPTLDLNRLREGYPRISPENGACLANAAIVCLEERRHQAGVTLTIKGNLDGGYLLGWAPIDDRIRSEWSDPQEATEQGACGIAILLVCGLTEYHVVQRSWKGTGFDYWLGLKEDELFQNAARLEVSGIRQGGDKDMEKRIKQKTDQISKSDRMRVPAFVVVVEFGRPLAAVVRP